jgi:hypothetical protein
MTWHSQNFLKVMKIVNHRKILINSLKTSVYPETLRKKKVSYNLRKDIGSTHIINPISQQQITFK